MFFGGLVKKGTDHEMQSLKIQLFQKEAQQLKLGPLDSNNMLRVNLAYLFRNKIFILLRTRLVILVIITELQTVLLCPQNSMPMILEFAISFMV